MSIKKEKLQKVIDEHKSKKEERTSSSSPSKTVEASSTSRDEDQGHEGDEEMKDIEEAVLTATKVQTWVGSDGKHGVLKSCNVTSREEEQKRLMGGMRNPYKSVLDNSALRSLGLKIRAAWETLVRRKPSALRVAENYGTPHCQFDENIIKEWKDTLKKLVGANAPPVLSIEGKLEYKPPLNAEIIEAWVERGGDKETQVPKWIKHGAPLGIEVPIGTCGIFPPADVEGPGVATEMELEDASAQLPKGGTTVRSWTTCRTPRSSLTGTKKRDT